MVTRSQLNWRLRLGMVFMGCAVGLMPNPPAAYGDDENDYYRLVSVQLGIAETASRDPQWKPQRGEVPLEISGMQRLSDGRLAVAIRKGEVWILENAYEDPPQPLRMTRFAQGLHEPLGLLKWDDGFLVAQRTQVTRLRDSDHDGRAERYETFAQGWGVSGNYHEYAYGPERDGSGRLWVTLNLGIGEKADPPAAWRGWALALDEAGTWQPMCAGLRSPSGLGTNSSGDLFATDQQGDWIGTCSLLHLRRGAFFGHPKSLASADPSVSPIALQPEDVPAGLDWPEALARVPELTPPAVWFPYKKAGQSATDVVCDETQGAFGPFAGQLFVGEFRLSGVYRVALEKVAGEYQGAVFPFRSGLACGVVRLEFGEDGSLFAGLTNRGWSSLGQASYGLQRLVWTGKVPFEIHHIEATSCGFDLVLTQPWTAVSGLNEPGDAQAVQVESYTYTLHPRYGSDERQTRSHDVQVERVPGDARRVRLTVADLRAGYVYEIRCPGIGNEQGTHLLHPDAYYTLNRIPDSEPGQ